MKLVDCSGVPDMMRMSLAQQDNLDLSIVIPVYNDTIKFENLLASYFQAFSKTELQYEMIIVDNNSPKFDEIYSIVKKFRPKMNVTVVVQPPLHHSFSLCSARNRGVLNSRGTFIFFTDSDCMVDENFARTLAETCRTSQDMENNSSLVFTGERVFVKIPDYVLAESTVLDTLKQLPRVPSASNYGMVKDRRFPWIQNLPKQEHPWNFVHGCFILLRKSDYLSIGGSDTQYDGQWGYEEIDLIYRMVIQLNTKVVYLESAKVFHQEFQSDLEKIAQNTARSNKSTNPNYQRICQRIPGFDEFKKMQWETLNIATT